MSRYTDSETRAIEDGMRTGIPPAPFAVMFTRPLGWEVQSQWHPNADVIGEVARSGAGNLVIRAGQRLEGGGWEKRLHIVLNEDEARDLVESIEQLFPRLRR